MAQNEDAYKRQSKKRNIVHTDKGRFEYFTDQEGSLYYPKGKPKKLTLAQEKEKLKSILENK